MRIVSNVSSVILFLNVLLLTSHTERTIFLANLEFIVLVRNTFDSRDLHLRTAMDLQTLNGEIDALSRNMTYRLVCHVQQKVPEQKRNNWVFKFVRANLRRAVAAMIIIWATST